MIHTPRRVLLVSATIGEGHNATARAVTEAVRACWPQCEVVWVDSLETMGRGVGPTFRWIYVVNVKYTPWLYNMFYAALWRYRWFADASRRFVGAWSGRKLLPLLRKHQPDLVVSTYPLGTAGLHWLRRHGHADVPLIAVISDFSPHPFWVYPDIDLHYVMSQASLRAMYRAQPDAAGAVCVPPVTTGFRPAPKAPARNAFDLPENGFVVLISCGSLGLGSMERAVDAAVGVPSVDRVVVACGNNEKLRQELRHRAHQSDRVVALGWVQDMPTLTAAADVVVTNAGGATALEALACGRAVAMFEPIAGHGRANAELMADAGLAKLCPTQQDLADALHIWATDDHALLDSEQRALHHAQSGDFRGQIEQLPQVPRHTGQRPLRPEDAFFVHATTPAVPQQTGAVLCLDGRPDMSLSAWEEHLSDLIRERTADLPLLRRRLIRRGRRPFWVEVDEIDPSEHVRCGSAGSNDGSGGQQMMQEFFATPVRLDRPPWELKLIHDGSTDRTALLAKMHHSLGDGIAVTSTLLGLLSDTAPEPVFHPRARPGSPWRWRDRARQFGKVVRGLRNLATAGTAPPTGLEGDSTSGRRFGWVELPSVTVRARARAYEVGTSALLVTVVAEALHRLLDARSATTPGQRMRVMVPKTTRAHSGRWMPNNRTVTLAVDLPVGPMTPVQRLSEVSRRLRVAEQRGQPAAALAALSTLGMLPTGMHAWAVRTVYQRRFFSAVVSVLPGTRRPWSTAGASITGVFPVLPLADGVGVAVGAISWGERIGLSMTADARLVCVTDRFAEHVRAAFDDLQPLNDAETRIST